MVDGGLVGGGAAEDFRLPGVEVGVEVDDGDGAVGLVDAAQQGEGDAVVAAEGDEAGEGGAGFGETGEAGVGVGFAREEGVVAGFDLLEGVGVVVGCYGDVCGVC